jgi:hypothetical protein
MGKPVMTLVNAAAALREARVGLSFGFPKVVEDGNTPGSDPKTGNQLVAVSSADANTHVWLKTVASKGELGRAAGNTFRLGERSLLTAVFKKKAEEL